MNKASRALLATTVFLLSYSTALATTISTNWELESNQIFGIVDGKGNPGKQWTTESSPISFNILNLGVGDAVTLNIAFNNMAHLELRDLGQGFKDNQDTELARVDLINSLGSAVSPSLGTMRSLLEFLDVQGNLIPVSPRGPQWSIPLPGGSTPSLGNGVDTNLTGTSFTFHGLRLTLTLEELFDPTLSVVFDTIEIDLASEDIQIGQWPVPEPVGLFLMSIGLAGVGFARRRSLSA